METRLRGQVYLHGPPRFKPTYKGWKHWYSVTLYTSSIRFKPTYKGWKQAIKERAIKARKKVLSLPTRDGNSTRTDSFPQRYTSFKPTYKGWKPKWLAAGKGGNGSFKPTYKGWKLLYHDAAINAASGFKPTYKGWKPTTLARTPLSVKGFKPTYKGWKHECRIYACGGPRAVLSLPTRDGNITITAAPPKRRLVLSLPTRDGNFYPSFLHSPQYLVLSLPTRDGNFTPSTA